jgi:hypothetical protein
MFRAPTLELAPRLRREELCTYISSPKRNGIQPEKPYDCRIDNPHLTFFTRPPSIAAKADRLKPVV